MHPDTNTLWYCAFLALAAAADRRLARMRAMRWGVTPIAAASSANRRCSSSLPPGTPPVPLLPCRLLNRVQLL